MLTEQTATNNKLLYLDVSTWLRAQGLARYFVIRILTFFQTNNEKQDVDLAKYFSFCTGIRRSESLLYFELDEI
jgi:hypothetical protein